MYIWEHWHWVVLCPVLFVSQFFLCEDPKPHVPEHWMFCIQFFMYMIDVESCQVWTAKPNGVGVGVLEGCNWVNTIDNPVDSVH